MSNGARAEPNATLEAVLELHRAYNKRAEKGDTFGSGAIGLALCRVMNRLQANLPDEEWDELNDLATGQEPLRMLPRV